MRRDKWRVFVIEITASDLRGDQGRMVIAFLILSIEVIFFLDVNISAHMSGISKTPMMRLSNGTYARQKVRTWLVATPLWEEVRC
jgi:hypothetical protein